MRSRGRNIASVAIGLVLALTIISSTAFVPFFPKPTSTTQPTGEPPVIPPAPPQGTVPPLVPETPPFDATAPPTGDGSTTQPPTPGTPPPIPPETPTTPPAPPPTTTVQPPTFGTLILLVKDAPPENQTLTQLQIRIADVVLHRSSNDSTVSYPVLDTATWYDLTALTGGLSESVGSASVPTGRYNRIVFNVTDARAKFNDTNGVTDANWTTLRVVANGKLMVSVPFEIGNGTATEVTLDFVLDQMHVTPTDILRPVIKPIVDGPDAASSPDNAQSAAADAPRGRPDTPGERGQGDGKGGQSDGEEQGS